MYLLALFVASVLSDELSEHIGRVSDLLKDVEKLKEKISAVAAHSLTGLEKVSINEIEDKTLILTGTDIARTAQKRNFYVLSGLKSKSPAPINTTLGWIADHDAPIYIFSSHSPTFASSIVFQPYTENQANSRQIQFIFFAAGQKTWSTKFYDLPFALNSQLRIKFDDPVYFDEMRVNVVTNWGNEAYTALQPFALQGPPHI